VFREVAADQSGCGGTSGRGCDDEVGVVCEAEIVIAAEADDGATVEVVMHAVSVRDRRRSSSQTGVGLLGELDAESAVEGIGHGALDSRAVQVLLRIRVRGQLEGLA